MIINLHRHRRLIVASGPKGVPLPPGGREYLTESLTHYQKRYDFATQAQGGGRFELVEMPLYSIDPATGLVLFPMGLKHRVIDGLRTTHFKVTTSGGTLTDELTKLDPNSTKLDYDGMLSEFTPYPDQVDCLSKIISSDGGIISAITGAGKSVCIRMLCRLYSRAKIHVVTKARTLAQEIYKDLSQVIPRLGFLGDGKRDLARVSVVMADSMHHGMGDADLVLGDEIHELAAPKYSEKLGMYNRARMFGFSATPTGRADNRDVILEAIFGPMIHTMSYQEAESAGRVVPITVEWLRVDSGPDTSHIQSPPVRDRVAIWQNHTRNQIIANRVRDFGDEEQVIIMVKTIEHAVRLKALLPSFTLAYAADGMDDDRRKAYIRNGLLPHDEPQMTSERIKSLREQFADNKLKKVIANYVWSTGVNFRHLGVLVRADAAASEIRDGQIPGRICRRIPGVKESAILIDCADSWDDRYYRKAQSRRRNYERKGWLQLWSNAGSTQP